jgi:hypothetical protein
VEATGLNGWSSAELSTTMARSTKVSRLHIHPHSLVAWRNLVARNIVSAIQHSTLDAQRGQLRRLNAKKNQYNGVTRYLRRSQGIDLRTNRVGENSLGNKARSLLHHLLPPPLRQVGRQSLGRFTRRRACFDEHAGQHVGIDKGQFDSLEVTLIKCAFAGPVRADQNDQQGSWPLGQLRQSREYLGDGHDANQPAT